MIRLAFLAILLAGCAGMPAPAAPASQPSRDCPPLPELRARASGLERRIHTQTIVRLYVACAGGAHDR